MTGWQVAMARAWLWLPLPHHSLQVEQPWSLSLRAGLETSIRVLGGHLEGHTMPAPGGATAPAMKHRPLARDSSLAEASSPASIPSFPGISLKFRERDVVWWTSLGHSPALEGSKSLQTLVFYSFFEYNDSIWGHKCLEMKFQLPIAYLGTAKDAQKQKKEAAFTASLWLDISFLQFVTRINATK